MINYWLEVSIDITKVGADNSKKRYDAISFRDTLR